MLTSKHSSAKTTWALPLLFAIFFVSGFTALLYQVVWQRMLGLFSGSDVRSVTIVVASYLAGLGLGSLLGGILSDRLSSRQIIKVYGISNLAIALFAVFSRFLFYDLLFRRFSYLAESLIIVLAIAFFSLLIPTFLMGLSLPMLSKAISRKTDRAASRIGWLYGVNTLGSGLGSLISGWYIVGTFGYEGTIYLGAFFNTLVGIVALGSARQFDRDRRLYPNHAISLAHPIKEWCILVFLSGFVAISLEILWFRILDIALQSNAYTYAHLLAFILIGNALGSLLGTKAVPYIRQPRRVFLTILGIVPLYCAIAIALLGLYWQSHPELRADIGYIDPDNLTGAVIFKYLFVPLVAIAIPNLLLGFYFPLVQKAVQTDDGKIGRRVGSILVANILGNTTGSLLTGLVLIDTIGTANSLRLLSLCGFGFVVAIRPHWLKAKSLVVLASALIVTVVFFPNNKHFWASFHGIDPQNYFIVAEDATGVAAISQTKKQGILLASGQVQAHFPYMHVHALLGTIPALLHPNPAQILIIGLGSGGTPHTISVNPLTQHIRVVEILGAELPVLQEYSQTSIGQPLRVLFENPRYEIIVGDGRRELTIADRQFDIIEADAIQPWRSRAGLLYSQEFFQEVRSHLTPEGISVQWNVNSETEQTFRHVFPFVTNVVMSDGLSFLIGSDRPIEFNREALLTQLNSPTVLNFLAKARVDVEPLRQDIKAAKVQMYSHLKDGQPQAINTDLFPRSEYYLGNRE